MRLRIKPWLRLPIRSLVVQGYKFEAFGHAARHLLERFLDGGCHIDHISGGNGGNGDADSGLSVDAHQVACRGLVAFFNPGNVREPEMLSGARYDCKVAYVVQRIEISGGLDTQAVGTDVYAAGIHNFVLSLERAGDVAIVMPLRAMTEGLTEMSIVGVCVP